jgi:hypothetical protein
VRDVVLVPPSSLPRTSSGKPRRRETRQLYLDGALSRTDRASDTGTETNTNTDTDTVTVTTRATDAA